MRPRFSTLAAVSLAVLAYVLCMPLIAVWFMFWMIVGSTFQRPDRLANRYYRLAVWPLLLPVGLHTIKSAEGKRLMRQGAKQIAAR